MFSLNEVCSQLHRIAVKRRKYNDRMTPQNFDEQRSTLTQKRGGVAEGEEVEYAEYDPRPQSAIVQDSH